MKYDKKERYYWCNGFKYKVPLYPLWVYRGYSQKNGNQRLVFANLDYNAQEWKIIDTKTGYAILSGLDRMSENSFYQICRILMLFAPIAQRQKGKPRVSRLADWRED